MDKENELNVKLEAAYEDREHELTYEWENNPEHPSEEDTVEHEVDSIDSSKEEGSNDREEHDTDKSRDCSENLGGVSNWTEKLIGCSLLFIGFIAVCSEVLGYSFC